MTCIDRLAQRSYFRADLPGVLLQRTGTCLLLVMIGLTSELREVGMYASHLSDMGGGSEHSAAVCKSKLQAT